MGEKPLRSTVSNLITSVLSLLIGLGTSIVVTRALGAELKGEFVSLKLIILLYAPFLMFGYNAGILYYGIRKQIDLQRFFWSGFALIVFIGLAFLPGLFPAIKSGLLGDVASGVTNRQIWIALSVVPLVYINGYCTRVIRSYHLFTVSNIRTIVSAVCTFLYYVVVAFVSKVTLEHALIGVLIGQGVQVVMNVYFIVRHIKVSWGFDLNFKRLVRPWKYGIQGWFNQIIAKSNDKFDQIILTFQLTTASFGIYTVGVGLSSLVTQIPNSYVNVFFNQIADRDADDALELYARAQRITFIFTTVIAFGLALLAYPLIYLMYGSDFTAASWVVVFYTPGLIFQVAARLSIKFYAGRGRPLKNSLVYVTGLLVSIPFYLWLVPQYGIRGAAIASSIAYLTAFLFSFYQINREYGVPLKDVVIFQRGDWMYAQGQLAKLPKVGKYFQKQ